MTLTLPKWYDLHAHLRQGPALVAYVAAHLKMGCAGVLAMPNTKPPVTRISGPKTGEVWTIESYLTDLKAAGGNAFEDIIVPLYLTRDTTPQMIEAGAASGLLRSCKYYPPHGTTNADYGAPMGEFIGGDAFRTMEECGVVLNIHGEEHGLVGADYFDRNRNAESVFYLETMPRLLESHPKLRIACEHLTTKEAAEFVEAAPDHVVGTITPQHLLYTIGDLIQSLKFHLFCYPTVRFEEDRDALRSKILNPVQRKYFAGTDSAPHPTKTQENSCAGGCFTAGYAPQLYAMAFEEAGIDLAEESGLRAFTAFLCENGPRFYDLPAPSGHFALTKSPESVFPLETLDGPVTPLPLGLDLALSWRLTC